MTEDYPRTLLELEQRFSGEADCRVYLFTLRRGGFCEGSGEQRTGRSRESAL